MAITFIIATLATDIAGNYSSSGTVNVRMPGEALTDGAPGEQINVRNLRSQRVVRARVVGPGQVEVSM